ncbi:MAG: SH3 domain-containing protein, partial [Paraclostridium sp.]
MKRKIAVATMALIPLTATSAFAGSKEGIVTATSLNVRSGPSTSDSVLFSLKKNEKVSILDSSNGWYKISSSNGKVGWASGEYINTNVTEEGTDDNKKVVTADVLNMRSGASTSYRVILKLNKGDIVEVISESNGWSKIKYDGRIGYVSSEYLGNLQTGNPGVTPEPEPETTIIKIVNATSLNIRSGPSTSHGIVGKLNKGEKVEVISESNGWSKIKFKGSIAYTSSQYLINNNGGNPTPEPEPETTTIKVVNATSLNVRSGPSTSNGIVGKLNKDEKVEVISESNGWSKIKFKGSIAYTSSQYLINNNGGNPTPEPEPETTTIKVVNATS